ncbi:MAG TPA: transcriptional regulator FNR [Gammaproteobacteria bacterium]|nr:transcriptional regulator FNR [Acidiferrobacteraceae bacterium]MDP6398117.1 fumarate/nitrate reduction transcriptional regulator Fnr [Arenicellales bacterium]HCX88732.1 transcriptional regulator FNR [Gammaproteobacteria bacterium]MDP6550830.1 fumarate/nitrate reduction transcriptional regulator Fnr [Arenicellales bacterium]MDP6792251.1 fumarate/nitrate reduction transcriptional regulator Fnr [Arenicellales bacterium]|tara:strand:+ start:1111 stop:1848 length:738 start_codon:yes stop_codon:yes gene_type:complete
MTLWAELANGKLSCRDCSLAELCLPRGLDPGDIERFESIVGQRPAMKRGENIYRAGDDFRGLYAVKSGSLKIIVSPPDGAEQIIGFSMPGELFGFDGIDDGHTCTAVALERTTLCELPLDAVAEVSREVPSLHRELYRVMAREISVDQSMLLLLARRTAEDRLAAFLLSLSKRFADRGFSQTDFTLSMSRHDIANYLGLAAETVSRLFSRLSETGLLTVHGRKIHIQDINALRRRVDGCIAAQAS